MDGGGRVTYQMEKKELKLKKLKTKFFNSLSKVNADKRASFSPTVKTRIHGFQKKIPGVLLDSSVVF